MPGKWRGSRCSADIVNRMPANLCGDDEKRWRQAEETAHIALHARVALWNGVVEQIDLARSKRVSKAQTG
jgi:hypothetical protein